MTVADAQLQAMILQEVGDTSTGPVGVLLPAIWDLYAEKRSIAPRLQYVYALRKAADVRIGSLATTAVDYEDLNSKYKLQQQVATLQETYNRADAEIKEIEDLVRSQRTGSTGAITQVEPVSPGVPDPLTANFPDAGAARYRGSPYYPIIRRRGG